MRMDLIVDRVAPEEDEAAFVERHWTAVWQREGGPKADPDGVARRDEYRVMRPYLARLPDGARLLDGGCGLGEWTVYLTRQGHPTLGLDISRKTVEALQKMHPDQDFTAGDIRATGLPDASFDGYFSWGTFEHFAEGLGPCLDEARRVLKPGGYLFISVPFDNLRHALRAAADRRRQAAPTTQPLRFYQWRLTRGELRQQLALHGFEVLDLRPIHKRSGVLRTLQVEFGLDYRWTVSRGLGFLLAPLLPGGLVAQMLMAVARRPAENGADGDG
jgi:SAM-dependent methyltransferase